MSHVCLDDPMYLALAEIRQCEFWTADRRLHERVKEQLAFVRLLADKVD